MPKPNLDRRLAQLEKSAHDADSGPVATFAFWRAFVAGEAPQVLGGALGEYVARINDRRARALETMREFFEKDGADNV